MYRLKFNTDNKYNPNPTYTLINYHFYLKAPNEILSTLKYLWKSVNR